MPEVVGEVNTLDASVLWGSPGKHQLEPGIVISQRPIFLRAALAATDNILQMILGGLDLLLGIWRGLPVLGMAGDAREIHHIAVEDDDIRPDVLRELLEGAKAGRFLAGPDVEVGTYKCGPVAQLHVHTAGVFDGGFGRDREKPPYSLLDISAPCVDASFQLSGQSDYSCGSF
jgi:hypothetical protein